MSYKTPLKPVTHGVLKRYDFLDKAQNEVVNERDNRKIYVGKVSMSPFLYFCFLLQIPVCVSIFFSSKIFRDSGYFVRFLLTFARETGAWLAQIWPTCACLSFDRCGHWGSVCKHYNFCEAHTQMYANVCNLFKFKIAVSQLSKRWQNSHKL